MRRFPPPALLAATALLLMSPSGALRSEVVGAEAPGFVVRATISVAGTPAQSYSRFLEIGRWWSDEHTYSGKAANMTLEAKPAGCFCEKLENGGFIEHGRVVYAAPGRTLRIRAPFGPLHETGGVGTLTAQFEPQADGAKVTLHFVGLGFEPQKGLAGMAPLYDQVFADALQRFKRYAEASRSR